MNYMIFPQFFLILHSLLLMQLLLVKYKSLNLLIYGITLLLEEILIQLEQVNSLILVIIQLSIQLIVFLLVSQLESILVLIVLFKVNVVYIVVLLKMMYSQELEVLYQREPEQKEELLLFQIQLFHLVDQYQPDKYGEVTQQNILEMLKRANIMLIIHLPII